MSEFRKLTPDEIARVKQGWTQEQKDAYQQSFEKRRQELIAQRERLSPATPSTGLTRPTRGLLRLSPAVFERIGGKETEEEATWTCEVCGPVKPQQYANGYTRARCACQIAEQKEREEQEIRLEQWKYRQAILKRQAEKCFTWLGQSADDLDQKTFDNFDAESQQAGFDAAFSVADTKTGNLILWSDQSWGTGKTHLAAAICNYLLASNIPCLFATGPDIFNAFSRRMDDHHGYADLLTMASSTPLLVIDDLDKTGVSDFKQRIFFDIFNARYKKHLPTVITTNAQVVATYTELIGITDYIGPAASSRLFDKANGGLQIVEMNGEDYRRRPMDQRGGQA